MNTPAPVALWVSPVSNLAGVARHILDVARHGLPGWRLVVAAPEGPLLDELRGLDVPILTLDVDQPAHRAVADLRGIIRRMDPHIVHSHLAKADFLATMAAVGLPVTLVSTEHHIPEDPRVFHSSKAKAWSRQSAHHARTRRAARLIAVSESTKRDMERYWRPSAPITVIKNGVDRTTAPPRSPGLRLLSLARLDAEKNIDATLRIFRQVRAQQPGATLTIAGMGPEADRLRAVARELGVDDATNFAGFVDAREALASHDVLVQPSRADNLSYTLLDAVNSGLGVVASDIGGNPEILPPRCLAPVSDESAMADAVIEQGLDVSKRPHLPDDIPTVSEMVDAVLDVYAELGLAPADLGRELATPVRAAKPAVSVVTAYYKNHATLGEQLDALVAQVDAPPFEVVVADNEGSARLARIVERYRGALDIRVVPANDVQGQCHARNVGVTAARAEVIAMSDADDVVGERWVATLHRVVSQTDVLATGMMRLDVINSEFVCRAKAVADGLDQVPHPYEQGPFSYLGYEVFVFGSNIGIRRSTYLEVGGMNEAMLGGSEDVDFSWRLLESGRTIVVDPGATVHYRLRAGTYDAMTQGYRYSRAQLGLWRRSQLLGRPVRGMSFRWAVTETAKLPLSWAKARGLSAEERFALAGRTGWITGNLAGQIAVRGPWYRPPEEPCPI